MGKLSGVRNLVPGIACGGITCVLGITEMVARSIPVDSQSLSILILCAITVAIAPAFPRLSVVFLVPISWFSFVYAPLPLFSICLLSPFLCAYSYYRGHKIFAIVFSLLLCWIESSEDAGPFWGLGFPGFAFLIWGTFFIVALSAAVALVTAKEATERAGAERMALLKDTHDSMASQLHNSVARELTRVVMKSEALTCNPHSLLSDSEHAELREISTSARHAMAEVRSLIRSFPAVWPSVDANVNQKPLAQFVEELQKSGFNIAGESTTMPREFDRSTTSILGLVLAEVSTNISKYAEPISEVCISSDEDPSKCEVSITNYVKQEDPPSDLSTGFGIPAMKAAVESIGGHFSSSEIHGLWTTSISIPLNPRKEQ
ncbi:sensor histidine kinase [Corynebacterium pacaense]|uniref:sensor histidine kinase n=1 Tax=Corynebacterium pacaense TaxID=1816684 RepID=UPI001178C7F0|nr:hypothetical protein [Corynebacterium pacaense]